MAFVNDELFPALKDLSASTKAGDRRRVVRDVFEDAYNYMKSGQLMRQVVNKINTVDFNDLSEREHFGEFYEQLLNDLQSAGNAGEYYTPRAVTAFMADRIDPRPGEILLDPACGTGGFLIALERAGLETAAQREIADRLDGKVPQAIVGDDTHDPIRVGDTTDEQRIKALEVLLARQSTNPKS